MNKPTLKASILVDNDGNGTDIYADILLFKEDGAYVWRIGGELGDEVEVLPSNPKNVAQAKKDFIATYPKNSTWKPNATWI